MTYRLENTLTYAFERCWSVAALKGTNNVAIGYDEGTICIQVRLTRTRARTRTLTLTLTRTLARTLTLTRTLALTLTRTICIQMGNEDPMASMDGAGKVVLAKHNEISTLDVKKVEGQEVSDGERLVLPAKELDVCEIYPQADPSPLTPPLKPHPSPHPAPRPSTLHLTPHLTPHPTPHPSPLTLPLPAEPDAQLQRSLRRGDGRRRVHHLHGARMAQEVLRQRARLCVGPRQR